MEYLKDKFSVGIRMEKCLNPDKCNCIFCTRERNAEELKKTMEQSSVNKRLRSRRVYKKQ